LRNWLQRLTSVSARVISRFGKPHVRNIPNDAPIPTAGPAGITSESAVEAWVSSSARTKRSPGSAATQGGANVRRLTAVTARSATIHCHESSLTMSQTSP
jgi:hypothetical protein